MKHLDGSIRGRTVRKTWEERWHTPHLSVAQECSQCKALMSRTGEFLIALAGNFFVAAIVGWLEGAKAFTISFGIGLMLLAIAFIFFRKKKTEPEPPTMTTHVENKPDIRIDNKPVFENKPIFENKPTIIVSTGAASVPAPDHAYREVLAFLERTSIRGQAVTYFVEHIATATHLPEQQVFNALQKLFKEQHVFRSSIEGVGTGGGYTRWGFVYWYAHF